MPQYRITYEVRQRLRVVVNAATEPLARKKIYDAGIADQMPGGENPQPGIKSEVVHVDTRRRIISAVLL